MPADHPAGKGGELNRRACPGGQSGCGLIGVRAGGKAESKAVQQRQATGGFEKFNVRYKMYKSKRNIMIDTKTFIQLAAIVVFVASFAILFLKREDAILLSCLFDIIGWLMLIYCKL